MDTYAASMGIPWVVGGGMSVQNCVDTRDCLVAVNIWGDTYVGFRALEFYIDFVSGSQVPDFMYNFSINSERASQPVDAGPTDAAGG